MTEESPILSPDEKKKKQEEERKRKNQELLARVRNGESTALIPASATWFPPRPILKKDEKEIKRLFGEDDPDEK